MDKYLITQSLLSAWAYLFKCREDCEDNAMQDFRRTLNREPPEQTVAMQNGIEFERAVYTAASGTRTSIHPKWEHGIQQVAGIVRGAQFQVKVQRDIEVCGMKFLVYGILDALKAGIIYDVKFKNKSFGSIEAYGSYFDSAQHPTYFYLVPEAREFQYLVSDGQDLYVETYRPEDCVNIADIIAEFIPSVESLGLMPVYKDKWLAK